MWRSGGCGLQDGLVKVSFQAYKIHNQASCLLGKKLCSECHTKDVVLTIKRNFGSFCLVVLVPSKWFPSH